MVMSKSCSCVWKDFPIFKLDNVGNGILQDVEWAIWQTVAESEAGWIVMARYDCQIMFIIIVLSHLIAANRANNPTTAKEKDHFKLWIPCGYEKLWFTVPHGFYRPGQCIYGSNFPNLHISTISRDCHRI